VLGPKFKPPDHQTNKQKETRYRRNEVNDISWANLSYPERKKEKWEEDKKM
jgi:hypothetical protein